MGLALPIRVFRLGEVRLSIVLYALYFVTFGFVIFASSIFNSNFSSSRSDRGDIHLEKLPIRGCSLDCY